MNKNNNNTTRLRTINHQSTSEAFAAMHAKIVAVSDDDLLPIVVEIPFAVDIVLAHVDKMLSLVPELRQVTFYDTKPIVEIEATALACLHAHLVAVTPRPDL